MSGLAERAVALFNSGKQLDAVALLRVHAQQKPRDSAIAGLLGQLLLGINRPDQAIFQFEKCVSLAPQDSVAWGRLGTAYIMASQHAPAEKALRRHLELNPDSAEGHANLGVLLVAQQRLTEAEVELRRALAIYPMVAPAICSLAMLLVQTGRAEEGLKLARDSIEAFPMEGTTVLAAAAFASNYVSPPDPLLVRSMHTLMGTAFDPKRADPDTPISRLPAPGEPLRVGFVSPDLCDHAVARFLPAFIEHADRSRIEFFAYYVSPTVDRMTQWFKDHIPTFRHLPNVSDQELCARIRADRVHILFDLAGNTASNRLGVFASRAAPVQVTAIGYPGTTGIPAMDYRLVDAITDPPGSEAACSEKLLRLSPCFLCYRPDDDTPAVAAPPCLSPENAGQITFGSFNNIAKLSTDCLRRWASVLDRVPGSRLALKAMTLSGTSITEIITRRCQEAGIPADRLLILPPSTNKADHLGAYAKIDIALDTFPYAGTTTTCEALYMGVPVITLAGPVATTHASRVGISLLTAAGFTDFIAQDESHYLDLAASLAADPQRLRTLRSAQRAAMLASPLCTPAPYAASLTDLLHHTVDTLRASTN